MPVIPTSSPAPSSPDASGPHVGDHPPVAIVGLSALFPASASPGSFWQNIMEGNDLITEVPPSHWLIEDYFDPEPGAADKTYCKRGGFLPDVDFDPVAFGIPPTMIPATDTTQLLALVVARQVLEDAFTGQFEQMDKERMSIILGVTAGQELLIQAASRLQRPQWLRALREQGIAESKAQAICDRIAAQYTPWQESTFPGLLGNVVAGRIANRFDLGGTNCITDAACASSLSALSMGLNELYLGHSDVVITGGVDCFNDIFMYMCFTKTPALSKSGDCRPFADGADGTLMGEGMGMFAMKRLADAERDGDKVYAVIRGLGSSSDGRSLSVYAPLPEGQAKALRRAHQRAGFTPETIELVEAHGTGTRAGDAAEFEGLRLAFAPESSAQTHDEAAIEPWCALGSVKSQIGHTKAAAGAAGLFKVVMALHHKVLPPTIKIGEPNPKMAIDTSAFYLNTQARPWVRSSDHPRRAGLSSFGFGGSNFHVALEEYTGPAARPARLRTLPTELFVYGASDLKALQTRLHDLQSGLTSLPDDAGDAREVLAFEAHQSQTMFDPGSDIRLAFVAASLTELITKLTQAREKLATEGPSFTLPGMWARSGAGVAGKVAFMFPGQGSQYVGMGAELAMTFERARQVWDEAAGLGLHKKVFPQPVFSREARQAQELALRETRWAQPAIGADSLARLAMLRALGLAPDMVGGHSYGEVSALHAAGAFDATTMLEVAARRGELMDQAAATTEGAMTAVRLSASELRDLLQDCPAPVVVANDNSPTQVVISGSVEAIEAAEAFLDEQLITFMRLPVATAFHSPIVADAAPKFGEFLRDRAIAPLNCAAYANVSAASYAPDDAEALRGSLEEQITSPVRFVEMVQAMHDQGARIFVEVGPQAVLTGLVKRILGKDIEAIALDTKGQHDVSALFSALGQLSALGLKLDFAALWEGYAPPQDPRKRPRSKFTIKLNGANYQRPYPPPGGAAALPAPNPEPAPNPAPTPGAPTTTFERTTRPAPGQTKDKTTMSEHTYGYDAPGVPAPGGSQQQAAPSGYSASPLGAQPTPAPGHAPQPQGPGQGAHGPLPAGGAAVAPAAAQAFAEYQRSMAESHMAYLQLMERSVAQAQLAYMQAMETSFAQWCQAGGQAPANTAFAAPQAAYVQPPVMQQGFEAPPTVAPHPTNGVAPRPAPAPQSGAYAPTTSPAAHTAVAPAASLSTAQNNAHVQPPVVQNHASSTPSAPPAELSHTFMSVVADKTGYPADMLDPAMALEADLGIDSIKRVEILSAVQDKVPNLPELDPGKMAALKTLGDIVAYLEGLTGTPSATATAQNNAHVQPPVVQNHASSTPSAPPAELSHTFMSVVADKTGYPADMLDPAMALEADLGIDSIKRVEILSAVQDKVPNLPELDPGKMAALKTLGDIVTYMEGLTGETPEGGQRLGKSEPSAVSVALPTRYAVERVAAPSAGLTFLSNAPVILIDDLQGVAHELADLLSARGYRVDVVSELSDSAAQPTPIQVLDLSGLRPVDTIDDALRLQRRAFHTARALAGTALETYALIQDTGGSFGLHDVTPGPQAWLGGLSALAKTAALEWESTSVKSIDVAARGRDPQAVARRLAGELLSGGPELEVALAANLLRYTLKAVEVPASTTGPLHLGASDILVASGGARGVTAGCLVELARTSQPTVILLGRTPLEDEPDWLASAHSDADIKRALLQQARDAGQRPSPREIGRNASKIQAQREVRQTLAQLQRAGSQTRYLVADVRDRQALTRALDEVRRDFGAPTALLHAAGVLADKTIAEKSDDDFNFVLDTKVDGLRALLEACAEDPLRFIGAFSSVAARTGNIGQVDYAMANETLNKVVAAEARRRAAAHPDRPAPLARALGWGPWDGGMVDASLRAHFQARGVSLIDLEGGAHAFVHELRADKNGAEIVLGDGLLESDLRARATTFISARTHAFLRGHSVQGHPVLPAAIALDWLQSIAQQALSHHAPRPLQDFKVLRGVTLDDFDQAQNAWKFTLQARTEPGHAGLLLEVLDARGNRRFSAKTKADVQPPVDPLPIPEHFDDSQLSVETIYQKCLFHTEGFRLIHAADGVGSPRACATLLRAKDAGWQQTLWAGDPALVDGALQLALTQGVVSQGRANLPTAIATFVDLGLASCDGPVELLASTRDINAHRAIFDLDLRCADGQLAAMIRGLEMYFRSEQLL
ncbi:hypothetical protein DL240_16670 [Lujinxingia litoralis]|uniref:Uncharacterized protein n=1 Tax=Lujinxingia litoralis TaxID=2211119 RepID=A0A328C3X0_9DELT|nr:type I polyketide synthase [Lujinxingia litoralis]RAL20437.1 hypothetical protein DL240_16670 [Lujinxingia litoralis]